MVARSVAAVCVLSLLAVLLSTPLARAADAELEKDLNQLFELGWKPTAKAVDGLQKFRLERQAERKPSLDFDYAYAVVLLKQRRYDDALAVLNGIVKAKEDHLPAQRAKIFAEMIAKKYSAALVSMDTVTKRFPKDDASGAADEELAETSRFLGRMFGFLEGPGAGAVGESIQDDQKSKVLARLTPSRRVAFDEGRRAVAKRFAELDLDHEQTKADAKAGEDEIKEKVKTEIAGEKESVAKQQEQIAAAAGKLRSDSAQELAGIDAQLAPIQARLSRLEARAASLNAQRARLELDINRYVLLAGQTDDPDQSARYLFEARQLRSTLDRYDADYRAVVAEGTTVAAQRNALDQRRREAVGRAQGELARLERQGGALKQTEKRIKGDERRVRTPSTGITSRERSLQAQAAAFTTYEEFPFDRERQRILDAVR